MATSNIGASENTVKNAMAAPRLMARSFHHPTSAVLSSQPILIEPSFLARRVTAKLSDANTGFSHLSDSRPAGTGHHIMAQKEVGMQRNAKPIAFWSTDAALFNRGQPVQALVVPAVIEGACDLLLGDVRAGHGKMRRHGEGDRPGAVVERDRFRECLGQSRGLASKGDASSPGEIDDRRANAPDGD